MGKPVLGFTRNYRKDQKLLKLVLPKLIGTDPQAILDYTADLLENQAIYQQMATAINPFGDGQASERIVKIAQDYLLKNV